MKGKTNESGYLWLWVSSFQIITTVVGKAPGVSSIPAHKRSFSQLIFHYGCT